MKRLCLYTFLCALLSCALALKAHGQGLTTNQTTDVDTIHLKSVDGRSYDGASLRGSVVLLSFGATWCEPCQEELKALEQLKKEYKDKPVKFLWVSVETEEQVSNSGLRNYAKKLKLTFPVLRDADRLTFVRFSPRLRLPTIVFFDKSGRLSMPNHVGMAESSLYLKTMRARLDQLLTMAAANNSPGR